MPQQRPRTAASYWIWSAEHDAVVSIPLIHNLTEILQGSYGVFGMNSSPQLVP